MIQIRQYFLAFGDFIMFLAGLTLMLIVRFGYHYNPVIVSAHAISFAGIFVLWLVIFFIFNLYDIQALNPSPRTIGRLAVAMCAATIVGGFAFYVHPNLGISPRTNLVIVAGLSFVFVVIWRRILYRFFTSYFSRSIVLVGTSPEMKELEREIALHPEMGTVYASWGTIRDQKVLTRKIDLAIVEDASPETFVSLEKTLGADVRMLVDAYQEFFAKIPLTLMNDDLAVRIAGKKDSYGYRTIKRLGEILLSLVVLIATSPILLVTAIIKKIEDGGPVILPTHLRVGKGGKPFTAYKIRSMIVDADKGSIQWTKERDPRITPFGRIIRKLHIDEIPQFWNILKGDMSLIGPRPEQPKFVADLEKEIPYYYLRQSIKPGFTGWAQIKFRYARTVADSEKKWEYDLYYLMNKNLLLDIGIVLKTIQIIFTH